MASDQLDKVDYSIILGLQSNSRTLLKELAKRAGVSMPTAKTRLRRLIDEGTVRPTVQIDRIKNRNRIAAFVNLEVVAPDVRRVAESLAGLSEVDQVYMTDGEYNLSVKVLLTDVQAFRELLTKKLPQISGVRSVKGSLILEAVKDQTGLSLQPGVDVKLKCSKCGRAIMEREIRTVIDGRYEFFCSEACATGVEKSSALKETDKT